MRKTGADSSALILLAKCNLLDCFSALATLIIPPSVFDETASEDLAARYPDAVIIADLVYRGNIRVEAVEIEKPDMPLTLNRGESDA
ncbi:MAG: hypothetical protein C4530_09150 [Desulfobacteraceae bacterium]|nr:MAG: hypothetical protein C4530_09150 [Desulfobacteraceae bacterium]